MSDYPSSPDPKGLLERLLDEAEATAAAETVKEAAAESGGGDRPSDVTGPSSAADPPLSPPPLLESLLSNPAVWTALPGLLENLSPLLGGLRREASAAESSSEKRLSAPTASHRLDRHTALLCALKPYLSPSRRESVETVIRLCRVWDALEKSGISPLSLLRSADPVGDGDGEKGDDSHVQ